jgi:WD40 repeat protein/serine/threonine protein kinase
LQTLLAGRLAGHDADVLETHLETCSRCQDRLEELTAAANLVSSLGEEPTETASQFKTADAEFLRRLEALPWGKPPRADDATALTHASEDSANGARLLHKPALAGYEIIGVLGHGGMGVVYQAWQVKLRRVVALKMLANQGPGADLARFRIEAEASARLQHPNIVQVHEVGEDNGRPYLTMEYVAGSNLAQTLKNTPLPVRLAAQWVGVLAQALSHAHARGIIHRDLKPANILLQFAEHPAHHADATIALAPGEAEIKGLREAVPKITDFGLAKLTVGGSDQTRSGAVLGTPSYMAPEQAGGKTREVGKAADIYGLGAILYELLTGRAPFRGETVTDTLQQVLLDEPVPPRRLQAKVPRDLETICLKCLEKDPRRRYDSAAALAEDVRRFLAGEPILARPTSRWQLAWKWARRKPAAAALMVVSLAALTGLLAGGLWYQGRLQQSLFDIGRERDEADRARAQTERERREAEEQRDEARQNLYLANIPLAQRAWEAARVQRVQELLAAVSPQTGAAKDLRGFEWHYLRQLCHANLLTLSGHTGPVTAVAYRPDGRQLVSAGADGTMRVWQAATGQQIGLMKDGRGRQVTAACYSPDGACLASGSADHKVNLWNAGSGQMLRTFDGHTGWIYQVAFSSDGRRLATASADKTIRIWDVSTGQELDTLQGHSAQTTGVCFSPDDKLLASAGADRQIRLWDLANRQPPRVLEGHLGWVYTVRFSPDGKTLASSSFDNSVRLWDIASGQTRLQLLGHTGQVRDVVFSPDGQRLASASFDQTVRLWDAGTGKQLACFKGHTDKVHGVCFHPDGARLASAGDDGTVRIWDVNKTQDFATAQRHDSGPVPVLAFSADGKWLASGGADKLVRLWDVAAAREMEALKGHAGAIFSLAFTANGRKLASGGSDRTIRMWDIAGRRDVALFKGHSARVTALALNSDDTVLASASWDGTVRTWSVANGKELLNLRSHAGRVLAVAFSPDVKLLASGGDDKKVRLWDAASGRKLRTLEGHTGWVYGVAFSPDGRWLGSAGEDGAIKLWDAASGQLHANLEGHAGRVNRITFCGDGSRLASCGFFDNTLKVWHVARGQELLSLHHTGAVHAAAFSPDSRLLASSGAVPTVRIWNAMPAGIAAVTK